MKKYRNFNLLKDFNFGISNIELSIKYNLSIRFVRYLTNTYKDIDLSSIENFVMEMHNRKCKIKSEYFDIVRKFMIDELNNFPKKITSRFYKKNAKWKCYLDKIFGSFNNLLLASNREINESHTFTDNDIINYILSFKKRYNRWPRGEELNVDPQTINNRFGNYYDLLVKLGATKIDVNLFSKKIICDGNILDSLAEYKIYSWLKNNNIKFELHKKVSKKRQWKCDFYLSDKKLWLEYDGLGNGRPEQEKFLEKINFYKNKHYNYFIINKYDDIVKKLEEYFNVSKTYTLA